MANDVRGGFLKRRTFYNISNTCPVSDAELQDIVNFAILHTPSAFNSQSARVALMLGDNHRKVWDIVRETLRQMIPAESFHDTDKKLNSFAAGYGTVLFYEDQAVIEQLQRDFPLYKDAFPDFSAHSAGMVQLAVWTMLCDAGMGASLQHYGNLIEAEVAKVWSLDSRWKLIAQMPFGTANSQPGTKEFSPLAARVKVFS